MAKHEAPSPRYIGPPNQHGSRTNKPIKRITIHATVSPCARDAVGIANYFKRTTRYASAHYVVDRKRTIQALYDSFVGYHAPPNEHSLGIELCCDLSDKGKGHWTRRSHKRMLRRAAKLTAALCLAYDVPAVRLSPADLRAGKGGVCGHVDVSNAWGQTSHWDPGPYFPWDDFMRQVEDEVRRLKRKAGDLPPTRVSRGRAKIFEGLDLIDKAIPGRTAAHNLAGKIREDAERLPKR